MPPACGVRQGRCARQADGPAGDPLVAAWRIGSGEADDPVVDGLGGWWAAWSSKPRRRPMYVKYHATAVILPGDHGVRSDERAQFMGADGPSTLRRGR